MISRAFSSVGMLGYMLTISRDTMKDPWGGRGNDLRRVLKAAVSFAL